MTIKRLILFFFCTLGLTALGQNKVDWRKVELREANSYTNSTLDTMSQDCIKLKGNPQTIADLRLSEIKKIKKLAQKWSATIVSVNLERKTCNDKDNYHHIVLLAKTYNKK